jgi:hypothetical protein
MVAIRTGYRVTRTPGSPISDVLYFTSIVALALLLAMAVEIDGETYHYVLAERGQEHERYSTTSLEVRETR